MTHRTSLVVAVAAVAATLVASAAQAEESRSIAVFGDWPYSHDLLSNAQALINSVNDDRDVRLVLHVGDTHSGSMPCTGAGYAYDYVSKSGAPIPTSDPAWNIHVYNAFQRFAPPVVYTPGDNEWADCHKTKQLSSGAPLRELASVRELFFAKPGTSLGRKEKKLISQAESFDDAHPTDSQFVENVMWVDEDVVYATFNMPGGSNDDADPWTVPFTDEPARIQEKEDRDGANSRWLDAAFDLAARRHAKAVVVALQADMWDTEKVSKLTNYTPFVQQLAQRSLAFRRPVLVLNGDSHVFKADRPLVPSTGVAPTDGCASTGACDLSVIHGTPAVPNLQRIVVEGSGEGQHWLKLTVKPEGRNVFSWQNVAY
jgi:hypothetical protein